MSRPAPIEPNAEPGPIKPRCLAVSSRTGEPCRSWAVHGSTVCRAHGGSAPQVKAAAGRRQAMAAAKRTLASYGAPVGNVDPVDALLEEIRWTVGHVRWLRGMVQDLPSEEIVWGISEEAEKQATEFSGTDTTRKAASNVWVQLYREERKHLVDVCATAIKIGIEERQVRLAERQGELVADVIRQVLDDPDLALPAPQRRMATMAAARCLHVVSAMTTDA